MQIYIINRVDLYENVQKTTALNIAIQELADARNDDNDNIVVVDMESALEYSYSADMFDKVHPNDDGYAKMADVWLDAILALQLPEI